MKTLILYINEGFRDGKNGDEFYTRIEDIEKGLKYIDLSGKIVYCNCDDPSFSNFYKYLKENFKSLELKQLLATYYSDEPKLYTFDGKDETSEDIKSGRFQDNGDIMKRCDIVITNPPYSDKMPIQLIEMCKKYNKDFAFVGPLHLIYKKEVKKYICDGSLNSIPASVNKFLRPDGGYMNAPACWFTSLTVDMPEYKFTAKYNEEEYPKYSNCDAIECKDSKFIPGDYDGNIGVPYRFFTKLNRKQFDIVDTVPVPKINGKAIMARMIIKRK
jgi:hypothetical protein